MKTEKDQINKFLVLVPHRDIRVELQKSCDLAQIAEQTAGVYNFPFAAPLASLSQMLKTNELKQIAHSLRKEIGKNKIFAKDYTVTDFPCYEKKLSLAGPSLDIVIPQNIFDSVSKKINALVSPLVIGCFLTEGKIDAIREKSQNELGFRATAIANMYWKSLQINGEICYKWKIGKLCWLPRPVS
jgi:hypothetical protein